MQNKNLINKITSNVKQIFNFLNCRKCHNQKEIKEQKLQNQEKEEDQYIPVKKVKLDSNDDLQNSNNQNDQQNQPKLSKKQRKLLRKQQQQISDNKKPQFALSILNYQQDKLFTLHSRDNQLNFLCYITSVKLQSNQKQIENNFVQVDQDIQKFYNDRYKLFTKYDQGIKLDKESWYSVTPEQMASQIASRFKGKSVLDACCGCGGNLIQFAKVCKKVYGVEIDNQKLNNAKQNSKIYGVRKNINFISSSFFDQNLTNQIIDQIDCVFISPPWFIIFYKRGGTCYNLQKFSLNTDIGPDGIVNWIKQALKITDSFALFLPRNTQIREIPEVNPKIRNQFKIKKNSINFRFNKIFINFKINFQSYQINQVIHEAYKQTNKQLNRSLIELELIYLDNKIKGIMLYYGQFTKAQKSIDYQQIYNIFQQQKTKFIYKNSLKQLEKIVGIFKIYNNLIIAQKNINSQQDLFQVLLQLLYDDQSINLSQFQQFLKNTDKQKQN